MAHSCRECNMSFETAESLANHKTNFCIDSDWVDPEVMKRQLANEEAGIGSNTTRDLSFDEVKLQQHHWHYCGRSSKRMFESPITRPHTLQNHRHWFVRSSKTMFEPPITQPRMVQKHHQHQFGRSRKTMFGTPVTHSNRLQQHH